MGCSCQSLTAPIATGPVLPVATYESTHGFLIVGPVSQEQVSEFDRLISQMESKFAASIKSITVTDDESIYKNGYIVGKCNGRGEIFLRFSHFNNHITVWHEAAHAYHFSLGCYRNSGRDCDFGIDWRRAAGDVYGKDYSRVEFPANGLLDEYSSTSYFEDVATMTADCYAFKTGNKSMLFKLQALGKLKRDPRYVKKLRLLAKYGFISKQLCDEILE